MMKKQSFCLITHHLLINPLELVGKLVVKLISLHCQSNLLPWHAPTAEKLTILKWTGGPPNDVRPRCQFCLTVFHALWPRPSAHAILMTALCNNTQYPYR